MGVPSFYRWLVGRYPKTVVNAIDEGEDCAADDDRNPNGEFDNLYLDMNGIIHPCFHPDDEIFAPCTFDEVFAAIFEYIDRLFRIVRPRKLLYLAVDGVAPRAKMNQQRARRYRTAKDAAIAEHEEDNLRRQFESEGKELLPKSEYSEVSDSNVITPGTVFMQKLSKALEKYIRLRLNNDPSWKSISVILSDANVPGEGEHKIMSFIRLQRRLPGYNPNTRHCLYGLDADLIMLALSTHEIHFCVLREDVLKEDHHEISLSTFVANSSQKDLEIFKSREWFKQSQTVSNRRVKKKTYQFLNIWILREYLELDMKPRYDADIERIVDDFIFICFFTGNDFLPHLPSIEIHESGIDLLIAVYKKVFNSMGDYLINASNVSHYLHQFLRFYNFLVHSAYLIVEMNKKNIACINVKGLRIFIMEVGSYENSIFVKRYTLMQKKLQRLLQEREKDENDGISFCKSEFNVTRENFNCRIGASEHILDSFSRKCNISSSAAMEASCTVQSDALENTKELKRKLKMLLRDKADLFKNEVLDNDKVKLGCPGWKTRYYKEKFSAENAKEIEAIRKDLVKKYIEGLCWVLQYYFTGICSWSWYYPFYYGPFASDFKDICCVEVSFAIGRPFKPFDQLMAVLPPRSSHALPKAYRSLMNNDNSPIVNFYPKDFEVDNDGKRFTWQGVCKLPFIEEESLLGATKVLLKELQFEEIERNSVNRDKVFFMDSNSLVKKISQQHQVSENYSKETQNLQAVGPRSVTLINQKPQAHIPRPPDGVIIPEKTITKADIVERMLWHDYPGHFPPQTLQQRDVQTLPASAYDASEVARNGWGSVGRGKLLLDSSLTRPVKEIWKYAGEGWDGLGRGKLLVDRPVAGPSNMNAYGRGEHSAAAPVFQQMDNRSMAYRSDNWRQRPAAMVSAYGRGRLRPPLNNHGSQGGPGRGRGGYQDFMWVQRKPEH
ncbi:hypothetical protein IEQ34_008001 [Dendrobium chrysotoxum]|uniref:Uncharacterized protein n=1 Tax=Dendrobium chrysotoxum TaxID=161865 RepID=A0AAV7H5T3_DENCH|nr:hypothetical protein IEQ34_008001 [Dendrobium chrysotoxum]